MNGAPDAGQPADPAPQNPDPQNPSDKLSNKPWNGQPKAPWAQPPAQNGGDPFDSLFPGKPKVPEFKAPDFDGMFKEFQNGMGGANGMFGGMFGGNDGRN